MRGALTASETNPPVDDDSLLPTCVNAVCLLWFVFLSSFFRFGCVLFGRACRLRFMLRCCCCAASLPQFPSLFAPAFFAFHSSAHILFFSSRTESVESVESGRGFALAASHWPAPSP
jgi:hypothetical protein